MAHGFHTLIDGDVTVTSQVRFYVGGAEWIPPRDWTICLALEGRHLVCTIRRGEEYLTLPEAIALRDLLTTSSRPELKRSA